ncbi:unnamed protein product [Brachionus calyciflorus]|uniref:Uncharacterized protein n=1 Tax=Brachionus calyciflorus TaxID=104777 RepID=A0A814JUY3_9BILA|nr:unnamed protein product [Brachionus calyciflorus]
MDNSFIASQLNQLGLTIKMVDKSPNLHNINLSVTEFMKEFSNKIICVWGNEGVAETRNPTLFTNIKLNNKCNKRIAVFNNGMEFFASYDPKSINDLEMINEYTAEFLVVYLPYPILKMLIRLQYLNAQILTKVDQNYMDLIWQMLK